MMKKREYILEDETTYDIARAIAYAEATQDADLETAHEIGFRDGKEIGFNQGQQAGFNEGVIETLQEFIKVKFNEDINLTNISKDHLLKLKESIFLIETKEELYKLIEE